MESQLNYRGKTKPKILMVDDKIGNLVALEKVLVNVDAELIRAQSGNEALKLIIEHDFALALLDIQMPEMDGYELAEIMRSDNDFSLIPIIFISAIYTNRINMFKGFEMGAFSFITKPFEPAELINKVEFFISKFHTEKAFEDSRSKYMELYDSSPDMLVSVGVDNDIITECNETLIKNTGFAKEELIGQPIYKIYHESCIKEVKNAFSEFRSSGVLQNAELIIQSKNGEKIDVLLNARGIEDINGNIVQCNSSLSDISELKGARSKLEKAMHELELYNEDLKSFVYLTSHDLQEPMLTVLSFIQLLEEEHGQSLDKDAQDYVNYCVSAAGRMKEMITSLLDYLRIGQNDKHAPINLNSLVNKVKRDIQGSIKSSNSIIDVKELPTLDLNEAEIKHLFQNLLSNAIKFRKPNEPAQVEIGAKQKGDWWEFYVKDAGIGINKKEHDKMFQMFKQLHERGKYAGIGVGLPMCKKIVEHYGGNIWIASIVGKGTKFSFTLPVKNK